MPPRFHTPDAPPAGPETGGRRDRNKLPPESGWVPALGAYLMWGLLPLFWKLLHTLPALEILAHRIFWSWLFLTLLLLFRRVRTGSRRSSSCRRWSRLAVTTGTATLLGINWGVYVWAINHGHLVEASLGYFINPLVSVVLGVLLLKEKLNRGQWTAVLLAACGVALLAILSRAPIWIGLILALTFGLYGYFRKISASPALEGLFRELTVLIIPAAALLTIQYGGFHDIPLLAMPAAWILIPGTGLVTAAPLLLYVLAVRLTRLSLMGMLQYIVPTLQFLLGVFVFQESFRLQRGLGFALIWSAIIVFLLSQPRRRLPQRSPVDRWR